MRVGSGKSTGLGSQMLVLGSHGGYHGEYHTGSCAVGWRILWTGATGSDEGGLPEVAFFLWRTPYYYLKCTYPPHLLW